jgi:hypothetical protein
VATRIAALVIKQAQLQKLVAKLVHWADRLPIRDAGLTNLVTRLINLVMGLDLLEVVQDSGVAVENPEILTGVKEEVIFGLNKHV